MLHPYIQTVALNAAKASYSPIQAVYYNPEEPVSEDPIVRTFLAADGSEVEAELIPTPADFLPKKMVVAIKVPVIIDQPKAFFAALNVCGYKKASAAGWKCTHTAYTDGNWTKPEFDDKDWLPARVMSRAETCSGMKHSCGNIPADAQGIWADSCTGSLPTDGNIYCRLTLPQKCDLSNVAGDLDVINARCPDKSNAVATARFSSPTVYWLYANGQEVGGDQTMTRLEGKGDAFLVDPAAPTIALSFKAVDDTRKAFKSFLKGEVNICGHKYTTSKSWKCAPAEPRTMDWTKPGFDDSKWETIELKDGAAWQPNEPSGISRQASWVWSGDEKTEAYCRLEIPNPIYQGPINVVIQP